MFGDDVDGALAAFGEVAQIILGVFPAACKSNGKDGRVMIDYLSVGHGG